jgi:hypothetical protein
MSHDRNRLARGMSKLTILATEQRSDFNGRCAVGMVRAVLQIRRPGLSTAAASASEWAGDRICKVFEQYGDAALLAMTDTEILSVLRGTPDGVRLVAGATRHYSPQIVRTIKPGAVPKLDRSRLPVIAARCAEFGAKAVADEMGLSSSYLRGAISRWRQKR